MKKYASKILMLILSSCIASASWAGVPIVFSYQGKLLDQNGQALQDAFDFKIQLYDPTGTCLLYEEKQNNIALTSDGLFTLQVGSLASDSKRGVGDPGLSMEKIFSNDGSEIRAANTSGCYLGFTAQANDKRRMKVTVTNKTTAITTVLSPMQDIAMSPYSLHSANSSNADKISGKSVSDLIVVESSVTQSNLRSLTDKVSDILGMVASGAGGAGGGTNLGFTPLNPANNLSDVASAATARSNLGLSIAGGDLTGTFPNPTLSSVGTAGTYTKVTTDSKGRVTGGSLINITDLKSSVTGNWLAATGACPAGQQLTFLSASDNLSCQAYSITSAQVVSALGFTPAASGGGGGGAVNSVGAAATAGNPISVGGTVADPTIDISKATASSSGYLSSTDWNTFNNKQASLGFAPLNPANNLSDVSSAATARSNLGLSTAGGDLTGTFPNPTLSTVGTAGTYTKVTTDSKGRVTGGSLINITDLKSSVTGNWLAATGACPAGQQLTFLSASDNLSCQSYAITSAQVVSALGYTPAASGGGGGSSESKNDQLFRDLQIAKNMANSLFNLNGLVEVFVNTDNLESTGGAYNSPGIGYATEYVGTTSAVPDMTSTTNGTITITGSATWTSLYQAFDSNKSAATRGAYNNGGTQWITVDFGSGNTKSLGSLRLTSFTGYTARALKDFQVQGSNDNTSWTNLLTQTGVTWTSGEVKTFQFSSVGFYRYYRLYMTATGGDGYYEIPSIEYFETVVGPLTLVSIPLTADAAPTTMSGMVRTRSSNTLVANTDLMLDLSRDGGSTWTQCNLAFLKAFPNGDKVWSCIDHDISGQPSGTSMKYRMRTSSSLMYIMGVAIRWD